MKKVKWKLDTGFIGAVHEGEFEIEDNESEEQIEWEVKEAAFNNLDLSYEITQEV